MPKESIRVACKGAGTLALDLLTPLQGRLKTLPENNFKKLRAELLHDGFIEPISVWEDPSTAKVFVLNGHQRLETLRRMKLEGHKVPQIPVNFVEAENVRDAKRKVLALASNYGVVDKAGLSEFLEDLELDALSIRDRYTFAEFDTDEFLREHFAESDQPGGAAGGDAKADPSVPRDPDGNPIGEPDTGAFEYKEQYGVIVICPDAAHQERVYTELTEAGHNCRVVVT